jgi:hypothetical protein
LGSFETIKFRIEYRKGDYIPFGGDPMSVCTWPEEFPARLRADDVPQTNGGKLRRHLQFFSLSPEKVRQLSQGSTDGGKTWNVEYDFIYTRHKSTPESR